MTEERKRRPRYSGKYPKRPKEKYKELNPSLYPEEVAHIEAKGRTVLGSHKPIMVEEILSALSLKDGDRVVDLTLGYGGHSMAFLKAVQPKGRLIAFDQDPIEFQRTTQRFLDQGLSESQFLFINKNFRHLQAELEAQSVSRVDAVLADLGLSSMQIDFPERGFSLKHDSPLDLRMNPTVGKSGAELLKTISVDRLSEVLSQFGDEPFPHKVAVALLEAANSGKLETTHHLRDVVLKAIKRIPGYPLDKDKAPTRILQAVRIEVNEELASLEEVLRQIPHVMRPGGRVAFLSFHSGEDRLVKKFFQRGLKSGLFESIHGPVLATAEEVGLNRRAKSAKLRFGVVPR